MAMPIPEHSPHADLLAWHERLEVPAGFRAEVIDGGISVSPGPSGRHQYICTRLRDLLRPAASTGLVVTDGLTVELPATGERYIPDLLALPEKALLTEGWIFPPDGVELVCEVTSPSNAATDRVKKLRGYAASGIPLYLLVDRQDGTASLFAQPSGDHYVSRVQVTFGGVVHLPAPLGLRLETAALV
ncbi:Uma2 family endonuclease [Streptacidiphilus griseoplanus]|uniref:Uma2 family endonuclease n=1 Tax=Peterkaempfera griseoplana TaxID=66896 RepID=UPI0006E43E90|nr:Uma2 family endonuclease [Peterkaempfera griseoplana]